jgi:translation elongation factor EF-Tu-like GTPase
MISIKLYCSKHFLCPQIFHADVSEAVAGENVGVNVKGPKKGDIEKGMILVTPGSIVPTNHFEVSSGFY